MAEYDGLPLDTPTLLRQDGLSEVWATRTIYGGVVEYRDKAGSPGANHTAIETAAVTALADNKAFLAIASPTNAQIFTQVKALTRQMNGLARLVLQRLDATD